MFFSSYFFKRECVYSLFCINTKWQYNNNSRCSLLACCMPDIEWFTSISSFTVLHWYQILLLDLIAFFFLVSSLVPFSALFRYSIPLCFLHPPSVQIIQLLIMLLTFHRFIFKNKCFLHFDVSLAKNQFHIGEKYKSRYYIFLNSTGLVKMVQASGMYV